MENMSVAKQYIELTRLFEEAEKGFVTDNIERLFGYTQTYQGSRNNERVTAISIASETQNVDTIRAWTNRSRGNVKIPLYKLCKIAESKQISVVDLLTKKIPTNRKWDDFSGINSRQKALFKKIDERDFYNNGEWDVDSLVKTIDSYGKYESNRDQLLYDDCCMWFCGVLGIKTGRFIDSIKERIDNYLKG